MPHESFEIHVDRVFKSFKGGRYPVLKGVQLGVRKGELVYVLGASGSGKSVLLKHVLGLLKPDAGEVWVCGKNISTLGGEELAEHRKVFGMVFQNAALFDDFTVYENVAFPLIEHSDFGDTQIQQKVMKVLDLLGLSESAEKFSNELSGGMRKRVGIARAIVREPAVLLYDEPTTGLDPVTRTAVDELILGLNSKLSLTSVVISHDIPSALLLADRIAFLDQGEIAFLGTPSEFKTSGHASIREFLLAEQRAVKALSGGRA